MTTARASAASCTAYRPTPPVAAPASDTDAGITASCAVGTATSSAQAPRLTSPTTRVPAVGPLPSAAGRSTVPARSQPTSAPATLRGRSSTSPRFSEKAATRTSASSERARDRRSRPTRRAALPPRPVAPGRSPRSRARRRRSGAPSPRRPASMSQAKRPGPTLVARGREERDPRVPDLETCAGDARAGGIAHLRNRPATSPRAAARGGCAARRRQRRLLHAAGARQRGRRLRDRARRARASASARRHRSVARSTRSTSTVRTSP